LDAGRSSVVLGSFDNGLPAGIALHAEFRALAAAGLRSEQSLRAAGVNAAAAIGVDPFLGRIAVGAAADLVFVDGDPLANIEDALRIVAVVRNGRFFSVRGLIDRVQVAETVE
ncbi:MAG: amidohydrolase family protein, partial [Gammaproteobacteria bacterium]|nr:amidohydrolase family protein [Gammaproteobacteria bacterium]